MGQKIKVKNEHHTKLNNSKQLCTLEGPWNSTTKHKTKAKPKYWHFGLQTPA